ncbi:amidohydrolase [Rhodohalobacter mucosus]|uniref:Amidohydrolase n=2 Tax=Rhodohalobacter mucosus TaxID=2079485 RepID=A0A316TTZ2_9BACT|nr:amidohydrolase [Rhodohalobacter mucosus]
MDWQTYIDSKSEELYENVVEWRRHFHQYPELSNREFETATMVAEHLRSLGIEVETEVAHTGVVGVLRGGKPGPVVGLRADMDALPVKERVDIPFASQAVGEYMGNEVPVMHACGHDTHIAILMGVAEMLAAQKEELPGTVKFIFQPAEEGTPPGEEGGAEMMVEEGVLTNPDVDAVFGLHIYSQSPVGTITYRSGSIMAASNRFSIDVMGAQTHGSQPWGGVDPIVASAQIINNLQSVVSRQTELTKEAAVITVGIIDAGVRNNIIPETAYMEGTIRTLDTEMQEKLFEQMHRTVEYTAKSFGAEAKLTIYDGYPITYNDPDLTARMAPTLKRVAGPENAIVINAITGAEDFSFFQKEVPGLYFFIGGMPAGMNPEDAAPHHTPDFYIEEEGMKTGLRAMANLTIDYMMEN